MKNEKSWERTDKGGSSTESFDLRGRVSLLFCVLFFVVVLLHIFFLLHRRRSQRRHMEERAFFGKDSSLSFFEPGLSTWGVCIESSFELSRVLPFFLGLIFDCENMFLDCRNMWQHNVSRASICDAQPIITLGSHEIDRRNFDRWSTLIFDWNISLKIPYVFKSICVFYARRCLGANASSNLKKNICFCVKYQLFEACSWDDDWNTRAEILNREHRGGRYSE